MKDLTRIAQEAARRAAKKDVFEVPEPPELRKSKCEVVIHTPKRMPSKIKVAAGSTYYASEPTPRRSEPNKKKLMVTRVGVIPKQRKKK